MLFPIHIIAEFQGRGYRCRFFNIAVPEEANLLVDTLNEARARNPRPVVHFADGMLLDLRAAQIAVSAWNILKKVMEEVEKAEEKFTFEQGLQCVQFTPVVAQIGFATADFVSKASSSGLTNVIEVSDPPQKPLLP
jgi:hypothetical protein